MKKSTRIHKFILTFGMIVTVLGTTSQQVIAAPKVIEQVVAVVNNNVILESDVNDMLKNIKSASDPQNLPDDKILRSQIIERLVVETLILQEGAKFKIAPSDNDVTQAITSIAADNNMSIDDLRGYISQLGSSYNNYRERIRKDMIIDQTRMSIVRDRVNVTPQEVDSLSSTLAKQPMNNIDVNISHILIATPENPTRTQLADADKKAQDVANRARAGENFTRLAATYSNDESALSGGNLGWQKVNELPSLFEDKVLRAQKGEIIGPIRSGVGFHILKVENTRSAKPEIVKVLEVNARHILLKTNVLFTDEMAREKLAVMRKEILDGKLNFADLAKSYSEDPGSAEKGGELGWSMPERYDADFRAALLKLKKDEISQPIKSAFGWHLIQLIDTRQEDRTDMAQKEKAYRMIFNRKFSEELQVWIQELRAGAYVNIIGENNEDK